MTATGFPTSFRRWISISTLSLALCLMLGGNLSAQTDPEPPANSYVALRVLPTTYYGDSINSAELKNHPLFRLVGVAGQRMFQVKPLEFLDETFDGFIVAALLEKRGDGGASALKAFAEDRDARTNWKRTVDELKSLDEDLKDYFGHYEKYPEDLDTYFDEVRYYGVSLPSGVSYKYDLLNDGKDFRLAADLSDSPTLARLGKAPKFGSKDEAKNLLPTAQPLPLNAVAAFGLKDQSKLRKILNQEIGQSQDGVWPIKSADPSIPEFMFSIQGDWLIVSDQKSNIDPFYRSLIRQAPGWESNPAFRRVVRNLDPTAPFLMFVDTQVLIDAFAPRNLDPQQAKIASVAGPMGYSVIPYNNSQARIEMFMGVDAPAGSQLEEFFQSSQGQSPGAALSAANVPWDASNVFALDYQNSKRLLDSVVEMFPGAQEQYDSGQDVLAGMLGFDAEVGFSGLLADSAIVSFERIDIVLNALESYVTTGEVGDQEKHTYKKAYDSVARVPATFAFKIPSQVNRDAAVKLLQPVMGTVKESRNLFGVPVMTGERELASYAVDGDWFYFSGGRTERLMRHMLEASHGRKDTLGSLQTWGEFSVGAKGHLLAFGHQKVDSVYSIVKGFLLMLGSDFRPLAMELGKLRDYHSIMTAVPDGFMMVGEIVQGDGR